MKGPALLFCPGDRPDRYARAAAASDAVVLDLEDAVAPDAKDAARAAVMRGLADLDPAAVVVRVNATGTPWHAADVAALAAFPDVTLMLPMAQRPEDVEALGPHPVVALCETARGVLEAPRIAAASTSVGLMWGSEDLLADLGGRSGRAPDGTYRPALAEARTRILYAARAAGVAPIDTVLVALDDLDLLAADSADAAAAGYAAKACIHPVQIAVVRAAFRPGDDEISQAEDVLAAAAGQPGVFRFRGRMVDAPVLARAREILRLTHEADATTALRLSKT
ncbi:CoA ester lyase [Pseudonocardia petroleophila]|uniref:CoA ester lyase n=1 Tax=Pseudonocardia petroleophila TaxID=37331 RepID=A0A7G7MCG3_9PSEU|nr:CoA ester lyase [Pseudonocardia petroleophila]QNG50474.1 CoA ester lyase [Pseudonocardia petroleophila]